MFICLTRQVLGSKILCESVPEDKRESWYSRTIVWHYIDRWSASKLVLQTEKGFKGLLIEKYNSQNKLWRDKIRKQLCAKKLNQAFSGSLFSQFCCWHRALILKTTSWLLLFKESHILWRLYNYKLIYIQ